MVKHRSKLQEEPDLQGARRNLRSSTRGVKSENPKADMKKKSPEKPKRKRPNPRKPVTASIENHGYVESLSQTSESPVRKKKSLSQIVQLPHPVPSQSPPKARQSNASNSRNTQSSSEKEQVPLDIQQAADKQSHASHPEKMEAPLEKDGLTPIEQAAAAEPELQAMVSLADKHSHASHSEKMQLSLEKDKVTEVTPNQGRPLTEINSASDSSKLQSLVDNITIMADFTGGKGTEESGVKEQEGGPQEPPAAVLYTLEIQKQNVTGGEGTQESGTKEQEGAPQEQLATQKQYITDGKGAQEAGAKEQEEVPQELPATDLHVQEIQKQNVTCGEGTQESVPKEQEGVTQKQNFTGGKGTRESGSKEQEEATQELPATVLLVQEIQKQNVTCGEGTQESGPKEQEGAPQEKPAEESQNQKHQNQFHDDEQTQTKNQEEYEAEETQSGDEEQDGEAEESQTQDERSSSLSQTEEGNQVETAQEAEEHLQRVEADARESKSPAPKSKRGKKRRETSDETLPLSFHITSFRLPPEPDLPKDKNEVHIEFYNHCMFKPVDNMRLMGDFSECAKWFALLPKEIQQNLRNAGFGRFMDVVLAQREQCQEKALLRALYERWWDTTPTFHFDFIGELTITPTDFSAITGLNCSGKNLKYDTKFRDNLEKVTRTYGEPMATILEGGKVDCKKLRRAYENWQCTDKVKTEQLTRVFILFLIGSALMPNKANSVYLHYSPNLIDVEKIGSCNWGIPALAVLYRNLDFVSRKGKSMGGLWRVVEMWGMAYIRPLFGLVNGEETSVFPRGKFVWYSLDSRGHSCLTYRSVSDFIDSLEDDEVEWHPWGTDPSSLPEYVRATIEISEKRILLYGPCGYAWYLGERVTAQSINLQRYSIPKPPPGSMFDEPNSKEIRDGTLGYPATDYLREVGEEKYRLWTEKYIKYHDYPADENTEQPLPVHPHDISHLPQPYWQVSLPNWQNPKDFRVEMVTVPRGVPSDTYPLPSTIKAVYVQDVNEWLEWSIGALDVMHRQASELRSRELRGKGDSGIEAKDDGIGDGGPPIGTKRSMRR